MSPTEPPEHRACRERTWEEANAIGKAEMMRWLRAQSVQEARYPAIPGFGDATFSEAYDWQTRYFQ